MPSRLCPPHAPAPNFNNNRRRAAIDHLLKIGLNPFDPVLVVPELHARQSSSSFEDRYLQTMRTMPRLDVEIAWELADMREQVKDLESRIAAERKTY
jgi:hypothetical protein